MNMDGLKNSIAEAMHKIVVDDINNSDLKDTPLISFTVLESLNYSSEKYTEYLMENKIDFKISDAQIEELIKDCYIYVRAHFIEDEVEVEDPMKYLDEDEEKYLKGQIEKSQPIYKPKEKGTGDIDPKKVDGYEKYLEIGVLKEKIINIYGDIFGDLNKSGRMGSDIIYTLNYNALLEHAFSSFEKEFGERKLNKIKHNIITSNKVADFILKSRQKKYAPQNDYILQMLNEIPYFMFSRGQTLVAGALIALQKWNEEANENNILLSEEKLRERALYIITESKSMFF